MKDEIAELLLIVALAIVVAPLTLFVVSPRLGATAAVIFALGASVVVASAIVYRRAPRGVARRISIVAIVLVAGTVLLATWLLMRGTG